VEGLICVRQDDNISEHQIQAVHSADFDPGFTKIHTFCYVYHRLLEPSTQAVREAVHFLLVLGNDHEFGGEAPAKQNDRFE
jgi:hypothetical protein